jgi:hypothetical protein
MKHINLLLFLTLIHLSCSSNNSTEQESELANISDDFKSYNLDIDLPQKRFADLIASVEVIRLEETDNSLLSYIRNLQKTDDYLVFTISGPESDVFVFDRSGNSVRKINRKGNGPEEYDNISDLWLESDTLVIYSRQESKILRYDLKGNFIKSQKLPNRVGHIYGYENGYAMEMNRYPLNDTSYYRYATLDQNLEISGSYIPFDDKMEGMIYFSNNSITPYKDGVTLFRMMSDTVYRLSENRFTPFVHFDFGSDWYWTESNPVAVEFGDIMQTTDKVWRAVAHMGDRRIWAIPYSGYSNETAPPSFSIDRSNGRIDAVDMTKADKPNSVAVPLAWDKDQLIFTVQSPDMRSFLSELSQDQIKFRQGTTLEEIESSENPVLIWVKFKDF